MSKIQDCELQSGLLNFLLDRAGRVINACKTYYHFFSKYKDVLELVICEEPELC